MISTIKRQTKDLMAELDRVDWPTKDKVLSSTYAVVTVSVLVGLYLWGADIFFSWLSKFLIPKQPL